MRHNSLQSFLTFISRYWPPIAIVLFALVIRSDMLFGAIPATGDHMIHLYKGWLMGEHMIPSGRLTGWSNMAFAGYPAGVYYPIVGDLLVSLCRYVTFGFFSWERAYAMVFLFLLMAMPLSVYVIARKVAGQTGALVAAVLSMGDMGGWPEGGFYTTVHWAVWPFMLGLTLSMFTLHTLDGFLKQSPKISWGRFGGVVILMAIAVLAHPMTVFFLGIGCPLLVLWFAIVRRKQVPPYRIIGQAALAAVIAFALTLFWTWPYLTGGNEWTHKWPSIGFGGLWLSLPVMFQALLTNELFKNFYWVALILGLLGVILGLISRKLWPTFLAALLVIAFVFTGLCYELSDTFVARNVQIERMAAFMKFIWFALAGLTIDRIGAGLLKLEERLPKGFREKKDWQATLGRIKKGLGPVFVIVLVLANWEDSYLKVVDIGTLGGRMWENISKAENWIGQQPRGPLDRVLAQPGRMCIDGQLHSVACDEIYHRHMFASGPIRTHRPKIKFGYEATAIFRNTVVRHRWPADTKFVRDLYLNPKSFENLHIRWVISIVDWPKRADMKEVKRFGDVVVYSVAEGQGPPVRLKGNGKLEVDYFSDERIRVRVKEAEPGSRILYPIAHYYPWHAYHEGRPLKISTHGVLPDVHKILMDVPALNGVTELRYERPWHERVAGWMSLCMWICMLGSLVVVAIRRYVGSTR